MCTAKQKKVDIRVIDLIKAANGAFLTTKDLGELNDTYACLGHFEVMQVRKVDREANGTVFTDIWRDSRKKENTNKYNQYVYPLYILNYGDTSTLERFWEMKYPCMVVSRVHCDQPEQEKSFEAVLMECVKEIDIEKDWAGEEAEKNSDFLSIKVGEDTVHCAFYQTLELGDTAVILKSNSLIACLKVSEHLMEHRSVGNVYSYCGLHKRLFSGSTPHEICKGFTSEVREVRDALEEEIPQASIRFSVHSTFFADLLWNELGVRNEVKFVTGTSDAIVDLSGKKCLDLISAIRTLWESHYYEIVEGSGREKRKKKYTYSCNNAFDDVVTRVGIQFETYSEKVKSPDSVLCAKKLDEHGQRDLVKKLSDISAALCQEDYDWTHALSVQVKTLLTMMNNCIMDDLSLLIWPSVRAFICRLHYIVCKEKRCLEKEQIEDIEIFLNGWATLSNDIVHLESQLMQNPKLQAPRVYVPAALMAFYMAFLNKLNKLLLDMDKQAKETEDISFIPTRQYYPLIAHDIGLRPNTLCILDPSKDKNWEYVDDCSLLVSLPISLMYRPAEVTAILCHEHLHYAGEFSRLREKRFGCILNTCAGLILNRWRLDDRDSNALPLYDVKLAKDFIMKIIKERITVIRPNAYQYIHLMNQFLPEVLTSIYLDWQLQSQVITRFCNNDNLQVRFLDYAERYTPITRNADTVIIRKRLDEMLLLYRECYADVAAIMLLGLDEGTYLSSMYHREIEIKNKNKPVAHLGRPLHALAVQAAIVFNVIWPNSNFFTTQERTSSWDELVEQYLDQIQINQDLWWMVSEKEEKWDLLYANYEYIPLMGYLETCVNAIKDQLSTDKVDELNKLYSLISKQDIDLDEFRKVIDQYHREIGMEPSTTV